MHSAALLEEREKYPLKRVSTARLSFSWYREHIFTYSPKRRDVFTIVTTLLKRLYIYIYIYNTFPRYTSSLDIVRRSVDLRVAFFVGRGEGNDDSKNIRPTFNVLFVVHVVLELLYKIFLRIPFFFFLSSFSLLAISILVSIQHQLLIVTSKSLRACFGCKLLAAMIHLSESFGRILRVALYT